MQMESPRFYYEMLQRGEHFYFGFRQLPIEIAGDISWPRYFLLCHSIELTLKAYLAFSGISSEVLRKRLGHKIAPLMKEAIANGLILPSSVAADIVMLDEAHRRHWARYPREEGTPVFVIDQFEPATAELLRTVARLIRGPMVQPRL